MRLPPVIIILLATILLSPLAQAHARPTTIQPAAGARLEQTPAEVRIQFSEPINARATRIEVIDDNGTRVDAGPPTVDDRRTARVALRSNHTDQGYLVAWSTYSTVDGHRMAGSWGFAVGNASPPQAYEDVRSPIAASTIAAKLAAYLGLVGVVAITWLTRSATLRPTRMVNSMAVSVGLVFLGSTFLLLQGASVAGEFFRDDYTRRVVWQVAAAVAMGGMIGLSPGPLAATVRSLLVLTWSFIQGFSSHASAAAGSSGALIDGAHLAFVVLWIGSALALWLDPRDGNEFLEQSRTLSRAALLGFLGAASTGTISFLALTFFDGRSPRSLPLDYGLVLLYKLAAIVALLGFAAINQFIHLRRLSTETERRPLLRANLRRELLAAATVFLLAAILSTLDPRIP